jgi:hypothetical protein
MNYKIVIPLMVLILFDFGSAQISLDDEEGVAVTVGRVLANPKVHNGQRVRLTSKIYELGRGYYLFDSKSDWKQGIVGNGIRITGEKLPNATALDVSYCFSGNLEWFRGEAVLEVLSFRENPEDAIVMKKIMLERLREAQNTLRDGKQISSKEILLLLEESTAVIKRLE